MNKALVNLYESLPESVQMILTILMVTLVMLGIRSLIGL